MPRAIPRRWPGRPAAAIVAALAAALAAPAAAETRPALDDFYDRTRDRDEGFDDCLGYCDEHWLAALLVGVQTANPSTDEAQPKLALGGRLGVDLAVRGGYADIARTKLWADVLRVHETGDWLTDLAWQTTAFKAIGRPGDAGLHLSLDSLVSRRTELEPSDMAQLQRHPYRLVDVEAEVAPTGGKVDKDAFLAVPLGIAARLRWPDAAGPTDPRAPAGLQRRTALSGALALRGFPRGIRHHDQLDVLRVKRTSWDVPGGEASSWTLSAGYQRLSPDIDWLQIWLLAGYEWAGGRRGPVVQIGAELRFETARGVVEIGPRFDEHLELDPGTAMFTRVYEGRLGARHRIGLGGAGPGAGPGARPGARPGAWSAWWGIAYEAVAVEGGARLDAITPEAGVSYRGLELGLRARIAHERAGEMPGAPRDRFQLTLDRLF